MCSAIPNRRRVERPTTSAGQRQFWLVLPLTPVVVEWLVAINQHHR